MNQRSQRVAETLRAEIANVIRRQMKDPRVQLATVSEVRPTRDLSHAKVLVSVLGDDDKARQEAVEVLVKARGFVRSQIASRVRLRTVPELHFELDRGAEHSQRINEILESLDVGGEDS